jgi:hypothetical protein
VIGSRSLLSSADLVELPGDHRAARSANVVRTDGPFAVGVGDTQT